MNKDIKEKSSSKDGFFVYIIRTQNNNLYIGHTNDLDRRKLEHKTHYHGAKFIQDDNSKFIIVYTENYSNRANAMKREKQLKGWTRAKKEALIAGNLALLKKL